jgi:hypothetical protein
LVQEEDMPIFKPVGCVALLLLAACSATQLASIPLAATEVVQEPPIGELRTSEVGDTLVKTAKLTQSPAIRVRRDIVANGTGMTVGNSATIKAGTLVPRYKDPTSTCYMALDPVQVRNFLATTYAEGGVCVDAANPAITRVILVIQGINVFYAPTAPIAYEKTMYVDRTEPGFFQELVYNGKTGEIARFKYREFMNDIARPAFDQDVQYDLRDGNIVGFKGARIEVIEATNISIKYKVLAHFPIQHE